ncbi:helix-turn-helix domain-containing protein [Synechococcus sp. HJ21-Hayes]|uniref:helix-turn-helix domain-containing protein n=1 Tax=unclassified Synechococcus TaxID=2626047 RepID=UPI0020CC621C|nr:MULTISPECIES: helix-turn-helix domain-containing protein [unclassified Synechococcus]MCP9831873.1 helix-turn-helix domain-containing protein [Synechococcus sp. JJ3a-Johnson]MCP9852436.1 helix-turn-helix domain-containing protein [Synechococcus sp. HJ21-Hayes]
MQPIKPIRNEADYELALQEIDRCLDAASGSPERDRLEVLTVLVDDYEAKHHPISPPEPIAAIEFVLEQRGLSRKDLEGVIGSSGRISEVMNNQRSLTLAMIRKLVEKFDLPADVLIRRTGSSAAQGLTPTGHSRGRGIAMTRAKRVKPRVSV